MKTFVDNAGSTWAVTVNVEAVKRVRGLVNVDLLEVLDGKLLERLAADPILLCDLVYALCKPEADARQVSDEEFGRAMAGDAIDGATVALMEELVGFFPRERRRLLARALAKLRLLETKAVDVAVQRRVDPSDLGACDALLGLVEEVADFLRGLGRLPGYPAASVVAAGVNPIYGYEHLAQRRVFTSVVRVAVRVFR